MNILDHFFEEMAASNPFIDNRVNGPAARDVDVENINARPFEQLVSLARRAHDGQRGVGAVLWGEAGSGKSHLLSRFSRWASQDKNGCFIYLHNLQASPENLPRSLLKCVVSILTRGRVSKFADTLLYRIVNTFVKEALQYHPEAANSLNGVAWAFDKLVDQLSDEDPSRAALVDRSVYRVLFRFFASANLARHGDADEDIARLAVRWLGGDYVEPAEARRLGLVPAHGPDRPVALEDGQQIKQVLVALARVANSRGQPLLLCFDQVDNLDAGQMAALARFLEALIDSAANLAVVTAGVQATLFHWHAQKMIQDSAWDRLAQFEIPLQRSSVAEAERIVRARLKHFLEPFAELEKLKALRHRDALFPLGQKWFDEFLKDKAEVRPRDVLNWAREGWQRELELLHRVGSEAWLAGWGSAQNVSKKLAPATADEIRMAIDQKVVQKMEEQKSLRHAEPHTLPPDADSLAGLVEALLRQFQEVSTPHAVFDLERLPAANYKPQPAYHLILRERAGDKPIRDGLLFVATSSAGTATAALRRLVRDAEPPERVLLITDAREPLPLAAKGKEYLQELRDRGPERFQELELSFEHYAQLDALQAVVGLARSGDLELDLHGGQIRPITEREVIESHLRHGRYAEAPVLSSIVSDSARAPQPAARP